MARSEELAEFVRRALADGHEPDAVSRGLRGAGWSGAEVDRALDDWQRVPGLPPVPRPRPVVSARDVLGYGLLFVALVTVSVHVVAIAHALIEALVVAPGNPSGWRGATRWPVAALVAFLPLYVWLHRRLARPEAGAWAARSVLRRWMSAASGIVAALVLLGSLAAGVYAFLSGDLTLRFGLKTLAVGGVAVLVVLAYRGSLDDWREPRPANPGYLGLTLTAVLALVAGLWLSGGPGAGRAESRDRVRAQDLSALAQQASCLTAAGQAVPPIATTAACPSAPRLADPFDASPYAISPVAGNRLRLCMTREAPTAPLGLPGEVDAEVPGCVVIQLPQPDALPPGAVP